MRACATANAIFLGVASVTLGFAACSSGSTPPQPPAAAQGAPTAATTAATAAVTLPAQAPAPEASAAKAAPKTAAHCEELVSEITNEPPASAVALNNAQTARDAGATDRLTPLTELIKSQRDAFRCCLNVWAKDHPGAQGSMRLVLEIKPDGSLIGVAFDDVPRRVNAPEVEGCVGDLAKSLTYPASPSSRETKFRYPFDFKARG